MLRSTALRALRASPNTTFHSGEPFSLGSGGGTGAR